MSFNPLDKKPAEHSLRKAEMWETLATLDTDEQFFPVITHRISEGVFLSEIAKELRVTYSVLRNWIRGNKERDLEYKQAEADGRTARAEAIKRKMYDTATQDVVGELTHADQLRAGEILLKQESASEVKAPTQVANIQINFVAAKDGKTIDQLP